MILPPEEVASSNDWWLCPQKLFDGERLLTGMALRVLNGQVASVEPIAGLPRSATVFRVDGLLTPGFFDIQVNGGGGVLFNSDPSPEGLTKIAKAHRAFGTTSILPTVITDAPEVLDKACAAVLQIAGKAGIAGIHIEGPHISVARRGTHAAQFIRPLDERTLSNVKKLRAKNIPVLITLAPEAVQSGQVEALCKMGAVVSLGHTEASQEQIEAALSEGAQLFTHLFNAMSPMHHRDIGVPGAAINSDVYCSVICDGIHVADEMIALAVRARPIADRMIIVSDAMPSVGGDASFDLYGNTIRLKDGRLINEEGALAGAHTTMLESVARMRDHVGVDLQNALRMAITNPARLLGIDRLSKIKGVDVRDLLFVSDDFKVSMLDAKHLN